MEVRMVSNCLPTLSYLSILSAEIIKEHITTTHLSTRQSGTFLEFKNLESGGWRQKNQEFKTRLSYMRPVSKQRFQLISTVTCPKARGKTGYWNSKTVHQFPINFHAGTFLGGEGVSSGDWTQDFVHPRQVAISSSKAVFKDFPPWVISPLQGPSFNVNLRSKKQDIRHNFILTQIQINQKELGAKCNGKGLYSHLLERLRLETKVQACLTTECKTILATVRLFSLKKIKGLDHSSVIECLLKM